MDSSRRGFLRMAGLLMAASAAPSLAFGAVKAGARSGAPRARFAPVPNPWPILQGPTDDTSATLVLLHPQRAEFSYTVSDERGSAVSVRAEPRWSLPSSSFALTELRAEGLTPGQRYTLAVMAPDGSLLDERTFSSLDTSRARCRFAVVSCMSDSYADKAVTMWEALDNEACDFVFLIGDTCYADADNAYGDEGSYSRRYAEARSRLGWFKLAHLTPTFATWDDHDFGRNDADQSLPAKKFTHELFPRFFGHTPNLRWRRAHGVGSVLEACGQRFFLFDDRSFRDASRSPGGRHWGEAQTEWFFEELNRDHRPAWLMNGSQFFGGYLGKESFEGDHPEDFALLLERLKNARAPVAFVSGDVHFSELMAIEENALGYPTYEFTSSSMHSFTMPYHQHRARNPRRLVSEWRHNFLVFDVSVKNGWQVAVRCILEGNEVSFFRKMTIARA
jgi:alkaline phosphatase D